MCFVQMCLGVAFLLHVLTGMRVAAREGRGVVYCVGNSRVASALELAHIVGGVDGEWMDMHVFGRSSLALLMECLLRT